MTDHWCPPFEIQEPHGAFGVVDTSLDLNHRMVIKQFVENYDQHRVEKIWAEVLIDDSLVATSYPGTFEPSDGQGGDLTFTFPLFELRPQTIGIRYKAKLVGVERTVSVTMDKLP
jgi:hypothetical protein